MYRWVYLLLLSAIVLGASAPIAKAQNERLVLAFYYAWYDKDTAWTSGQLSDQPAQLYDSRDRAAIQRHVAQARSAGIDAFVQSWYGPSGGVNNMTEANFAALLDISAQSGFRAAVDFEVISPFFGSASDVQNALIALLAGHARHPAYLKVNGKPVVFFWRQQRFGVDEWAAIREQVDPNHASIWIAEGTDTAYLRVFDGIHLYSVAWSPDPASVLVNFGSKVRRATRELGFRYWVATAMPGYDDTRLRGAGGLIRPRANGDYYRACFSGAAQSGADWVVITSFNEWPEGTMIEPSVSYGNTYLNLTHELAAAYRSSTLAEPATATAVPATATAPPTPTPKPTFTPTAHPTWTPAPTATVTPAPSPTLTATATATPTPTATASASPPTKEPANIPTLESPTPQVSPGPDSVPSIVWIVAGVAVLLGIILAARRVVARLRDRNGPSVAQK